MPSIVCIQPQFSGKGVLGHSPKRVLVWGPGGTQGPPGKGGAAERWRVTPSVSGVTRHGAQPATTRTRKSRASAASRTGFAPRRRRPHISREMHKFPICKNPLRARVRVYRVYMCTRWVRTCPRAGEKSHRTAENLPPKIFCPNREQIFVSLLQSRQKSCTMESEYHHFGRKLHGHREKSKGNRPRPQR